MVERELLLTQTNGQSTPLTFRQIQLPGQRVAEADRPTAPLPPDLLKLDEVIAHHIGAVLTITNGKINGPKDAAELLGIHPSTLRSRMGKLGIPYGRGKSQRQD